MEPYVRCIPPLLWLVSCVAVVLTSTPLEGPIVSTPLGSLRGSVIKSRLGRDIFSFRGVRFAKPPVGALRFKPPAPLDPWRGVADASRDGPACPQLDEPLADTAEDCLFLNVYTTQLPATGVKPRSVLVWYHPGGWYGGTGNSLFHGPQYLMDQDIVLVTSNYRLGALGFLSTGDSILPGNYGMKDQVAVMRWVRQNIAFFGGDPGSVTIGGYSVGGASVWFHLMSPMTKGLFHRAISMSGSISTHWDIERDPLSQARKQAALLACPTNTSLAIFECMRSKTAQQIVKSFEGMAEWGWDPILVYTPVLEAADVGVEHYMVTEPRLLLQSGNFAKVPYLTGITQDEFAWKSLQVLSNASWAADMSDNWKTVAPISFMYERGTETSHAISRRLREFYLGGQPITNASETGLGQLYADSIIGFGMHLAGQMITALSQHPVFYYRFSYQGRYSFVYKPDNDTVPYGVVHHDDLMYLFYISKYFPYFPPGDPETETVSRLTTMWANFVQTGNPTPDGSEIQWEPMTTQDHKYLDIGSTLVMKKDLYKERMELWDSLFPLD